MNFMKKRYLLALMVGVMGAGVVFYLKKKKAAPLTDPIRYEKPVTQGITQFVNASGNLKAVVQITVGSLVAGRIVKIHALDNDVVKKDQLLIQLDDGVGDCQVRRTKAELLEARANLTFQEKFYKRQKALFDAGQLAENTFDSVVQGYEVAKASVQRLDANLDLYQKQYNNLFVRAPEDSIVISKMVDLGQMVTAQFQATALYTLAKDLREMEAHINVDEADIGLVEPGQSVTCAVDAFPRIKFKAKVAYVKYLANIVDNVVTYNTVLNIRNEDLKLRPGMTINADIKVARAKNALAVPVKAMRVSYAQLCSAGAVAGYTVVAPDDVVCKEKVDKHAPKPSRSATPKHQKESKEFLWVLDANKTIRRVEVVLGANDGRTVEVKKGLSQDQLVVTEVDDVNRENLILKGMFGKPGGLGK
ncbi:MAG: Efflux transporter, RND family, MFP subunit [candidate division TM6 bacterium GW2011_GWF2_38_10]|nr:MAG: Efflux transporter, RND family, MFP subunit [candidate division TM6 bacterium GW2011_GWF2_38_10]